jgi:hypothetical protein
MQSRDNDLHKAASSLTPSEAIYGFAAWLTCREGSLLVGSSHDAAPMAGLCAAFCEANNLGKPRDDYHHGLKHPKEDAE